MKGVAVVAAAALASGVAAHDNHRRAHRSLFEKRGRPDTEEICVPQCTTIYSTIVGEPTLYVPPPPSKPTATYWPSEGPVVVPTPIPHFCPTPGTYSFPATTVIVEETTTVCAASTTQVPKGTHTLGGVTTVVDKPTTVTCPYAAQKTNEGVVTNVIETTTYVCPSAGTYTIGPVTKTVTEEVKTVVVPVVTTVCPGTYTAPAVVTVVETATVVFCPFESPAPKPEKPAPQPEKPVPQPEKPAPQPEKPSVTPGRPAPPGLGGSGGKWAMTYTPYAVGRCKNPAEVDAEISEIARAGFKTLRIYSTDCDTLPNVGAACEKYGLRLIAGIFIDQRGCRNGSPTVESQLSALKAWSHWKLVDLVVVANEALFNGFCTPSELTQLIRRTKTELASCGYSGPYTTTDTTNGWQGPGMSELCSEIDVVGLNAHAYFNAGTAPHNAGPFVKGQLAIVEEICGKPGYILETGWPSSGKCFGLACAGPSQQAEAIKSIKETIGDKCVFFSLHDDKWKQETDCQCEQHWGMSQLFSTVF